MDPREQRTADGLKEAILTLAGRQPVETVAVAAVCREAGITRPTFYRHAASPEELLFAALTEELDEAFARPWPAARSNRQVMEQRIRRMMSEVDRRIALYETGGGGQLSPTLERVLARHFTAQLLDYLEALNVTLPPTGSIDPAVAREVYATHAAYGAIGSLGVWMRQAAPRDTDSFIRLSLAALPSWWFRPAT